MAAAAGEAGGLCNGGGRAGLAPVSRRRRGSGHQQYSEAGDGEECSFLKKRTKKLLTVLSRTRRQHTPKIKSFLLLFFKKEDFS
jgi:hypothetical protein